MFRRRARTILRYVRETGAIALADGRGPVLAVVALGWLLVSGTRFVVPALLPQIKTAFAISNTEAGFAVTLIWLTYASLQFPAGLLTDRWGERTLLVVSTAVGTVSVLAFAVAPVFGMFLGACLLFGLGATGSVVVGAFADADLFDEAFLFLAGLTALVFGLYVLLPARPDA